MPRFQGAKFSFSAGVLSPRMEGRGDSGLYGQACSEITNYYIAPQGGLVKREGFQFIRAATEQTRLFQFHRGGDQSDLVIELAGSATWPVDTNPQDGTVELYDVSTSEQTPITANLDPHWFDMRTSDPREDLYFHNTERFGVIANKDHPPYQIEINQTGDYNGQHMPQNQIPLVQYWDELSPGAISDEDAVYTLTFPDVATGWFYGSLYQVQYGGVTGELSDILGGPDRRIWTDDLDRNANNIAAALRATHWLSTQETSIEVAANSILSYTVTIRGNDAGKALVVLPASGQQGAVTVDQTGLIVDGVEPAWSYPFVLFSDAGYQGSPGDDRYYVCTERHLSSLDNQPGTGPNWTDYWSPCDKFGNPGGDGLNPPFYYEWQHRQGAVTNEADAWNPWGEGQAYGPWGRGFPQVAAFFQQRCHFMAIESRPTAIWGSRIGNYKFFQPGANSADPYYFDLDTSDSPKIKWAEITQSALVIGTSSGDFRIGADVALGPTDIQVTKQNSARSYKTRAASVYNTALYVEQGREKLRGTRYGRDRNAWTSEEYSQPAEHLFYDKVRRVAIVHAPEVQLYVLRDDGNLLCMSWVPGPEGFLNSWTEFDSDGNLKDISSCYDLTREQDVVYALVERGGIYTVEKMPYPERNLVARSQQSGQTLTGQGIVLLDGWVSGDLSDDETITVNPDHNMTGQVAVLVDDAYLGDFTVGNGTITLDKPYTGKYVYGKRYSAKAVTFELSEGNPRGTALGTKRRWNKLYVRMLDSALPEVNGILPPDRAPETLMDIPEILQPGIYDAVLRPGGWNRGIITIEQQFPYPTHVLSVFGEATSENA